MPVVFLLLYAYQCFCNSINRSFDFAQDDSVVSFDFAQDDSVVSFDFAQDDNGLSF